MSNIGSNILGPSGGGFDQLEKMIDLVRDPDVFQKRLDTLRAAEAASREAAGIANTVSKANEYMAEAEAIKAEAAKALADAKAEAGVIRKAAEQTAADVVNAATDLKQKNDAYAEELRVKNDELEGRASDLVRREADLGRDEKALAHRQAEAQATIDDYKARKQKLENALRSA